MKRTLFCLLSAVALFASAWAGAAQAKDFFYYIGYDVVQVIDGDTDSIVADIPAPGWLRETAFTPDNKYLYVTASRHRIHKIDLEKRAVVHTTELNSGGWERFLYGFTLAGDGKTAYGSIIARTTEGGEAVVPQPIFAEFDLETGKILRSMDVPWGIGAVVPVKGGTELYAIAQDLYKIDVSGKELKIAETYPMFDKGMNILPFWMYPRENGGLAIAPYYNAEGLGFLNIDQASGTIDQRMVTAYPPFIYCVVLSPDRKTGYGVMDELIVFDMERMDYSAEIPLQEGTSFAINISSDGKKVYTAAGGSTITVFDTETLEPVKVLQMATDGMGITRLSL